jgi:hypothetical protein
MTDDNPSLKAFVKPDDSAMIVCPQCNGAKNVAVRQFRHHLHMLRVKCRCGFHFKVQLEFRRHYRKPTSLEATYGLKPPASGGGVTRIVNLSLGGACFEVRGIHDIQVGQKGILLFTLDNRKKTALTKSVLVRAVNNNRIGCEFADDQAFDKELGFYLRP